MNTLPLPFPIRRFAAAAPALLLGAAILLPAAGCGRPSPARQVETAVRDLRAGRLEAARGRLEAALADEPDPALAAEACNWLGLALRGLGRPADAADAFAAAIAATPAAFDPLYNAGCLALERGDTAGGVRLLRQATDLDTSDTRALVRIGEHLTRIGRFDQAQRVYHEARKRDARCAAAEVGLGRIAMLEGQTPQAENHFMAALEMEKDCPPALYNLGVLHSSSGGISDRAAEYFRQYLAVAPNGPRAAAAARRLGGEAVPQTSFRSPSVSGPDRQVGLQWRQAQAALDKGDRETAAVCVLRALEAARAGGNAKQREEIVNRALETFGDRAAVQLEAGEYFLGAGRPADALQALLRAQALEPDNPLVLLHLSRAAAAVEEYDTAVLSLRHLIELEPGNADARWELADLYGDKLGMTAKGISAYREFERLFPSDPRAAQVADRVAALESGDE
jgi:tetratricopeptide (TPR) repeat protein